MYCTIYGLLKQGIALDVFLQRTNALNQRSAEKRMTTSAYPAPTTPYAPYPHPPFTAIPLYRWYL